MRKLLLAGACVALAACGGEGASAGPVVRDSAGIRIVQNDAPAWKKGQEWRVPTEPALDIGVVEGEAALQFDGVSGVARLSDGRVVVADGASGQLRFFSADGRHLVTAGRKGGGPGEFSGIHWMGVAAGDSVLVWDAESSRMSVFAPDGRFARAFTPRGLRTFAQVQALMGGGALLMTAGFDPGAGGREGEFRDTMVTMGVPLAGGDPREVSRRPGFEMVFSKGTDLVMTDQVIFGRGPYAAGAPDGFYAGDNGRYQIEHRAPDGTLRRLIRRAHEPRPVTDADLERYWARRAEAEQRFSGMPPEMVAQLREMQRTQRERIPHRETLPAFVALLVDGPGNLWVRDPRPDDSQPYQWSVFDPQGRWLGTVQTPGGLIIHQIGPDWILGTEEDEMDVEHVRMYRIQKPAAE